MVPALYPGCKAPEIRFDPDADLSLFSRVGEIVIRESRPNGVDRPVGSIQTITADFADEEMFFNDSVVGRTETVQGVRL